jgi:hypothetical protein
MWSQSGVGDIERFINPGNDGYFETTSIITACTICTLAQLKHFQ